MIASREAGFTVAMIAEKTRLSVSTINQILASHGTKKGSATAEMVEDVRRQVRALLSSKDVICDEAALLIADDLAQASLLREKIVAALVRLDATNLQEAVLAMRAAAAMSPALKNTSDMIRQSLGYERHRNEVDEKGLAVLQLIQLSDDQVKEMRAREADRGLTHELEMSET